MCVRSKTKLEAKYNEVRTDSLTYEKGGCTHLKTILALGKPQ